MSASGAHIIVIGNEKGGSGKSTTSMHVAVALMMKGYRVATIDVDGRQGTLSRYIANREIFNKKMGRDYPVPEHYRITGHAADGVTDAELAEESERLRLVIEGTGLSHDIVVIDTPGAANKLSFLAHTYADTLVTPMNDSFVDLDGLAHMDGHDLNIKGPSHYSEAIWEAKKEKAARDSGTIDWIVMRNRLSNLDAHNKREVEQAIRELSKRLSFRALPGFSERVIFRELFLVGLTILDLKQAAGGGALSRSHMAARDEVFAIIDGLKLPPLPAAI
ncbi:division plane positioning ATPase MipZ [Rhodospirillales bacterium]|nr:division plane positioning ATPase MipZ [Rhodospirillales bacterium]